MSLTVIKGDDLTLVAQAVKSTVDELLGDGDRTLMVDEVTEAQHHGNDGEATLAALVSATQTPPFLTDRRIVVGRHLGLFTRAEQVAELVASLADPMPTTDLVLVWEKATGQQRLGAIPKSLKEAITAAGGVTVDAAPSGKGRRTLLDEKLTTAPVRLDGSAKRLVADVVGDDVGRVDPLIELLVSTYGEGARLGPVEVEPFLGQAADVPPWELTDAIDRGDVAGALEKLDRMMRGGERHALQVLATLHGHYQRAFALDGANVADDKSAAALLGMKGSTFPAKKALSLARRLGSDRLRRIIGLLSDADLAVRGGSGAPDDATVQVLVARLARLSA